MIRKLNNTFVLDTENTTYCFKLLPTGQLEHLYYGGKIDIDSEEEAEVLVEKHAFAPGNTNIYDQEHPEYSLEDMRLEMSSYGKSDIREPFIDIEFADGCLSTDFVYESSTVTEGKKPLATMPSSYEDNGIVDELTIVLKEKEYGLKLELHYSVFENRDVISRYSKLFNSGDSAINLVRLMSNQVDFETNEYILTTFNGGWAREMNRNDFTVTAGKHVNYSYTGSSSSRANPFVMLSKESTSEDYGDCYGFNLVYSGNHYEAVEVNTFGKTRFVQGINPQSFKFTLEPGDEFEAPEAVMTYSDKGYNGMSQRMHEFVRQCIVRGVWKDKVRPVLLNSWEAAYFDINESRLL